ncbi:AsmA family protein [Shimia sp. MIT1388]|uniref:AsmA family protein n=1 Tax=Shimia sp. MIT1388 TaxID=3096992 RepID=UPI00399B9F25
MKIIRGLVAAVLILAIGAVVLVVALPGEKIAKLAADQVKSMTGRELTFEGKVGISWYPVLGVTTEKVSFGNAAWSERGPMFKADKAVIGVDVMAAIGGDIRIKTVELVAPEVLLEKTADGRVNWDLSDAKAAVVGGASADAPSGGASAPAPAPTTASQFESFALEKLVISDAQVRYIEHGGARQELSGVSLAMTWPDVDQAADVLIEASPFGAPIKLDAVIAAPLALIDGDVSAVELAMQAGGGTARFAGRAGIAPEVSGQLTVSASDAAAFLAALGAGGLEGPLAVQGDVTLTRAGVVSVRGGHVSALGNDLSVQADVDLNGVRPKVAAQVATQTLRFAATEGGESPATDSAPVGWSQEPIDASALGLMDGTISFAAEAMDLNGITFGKTRATVEIDRARAVARIQEMEAYEGAVTGVFVANNRNGLSVRGDLNVTQIALQPFLAATADLDKFSGTADFESRFLSSGETLDAIMNNLSGDGRVDVGRGTIEGIDLDKLLRGDVTGGTTVFNSMVASWTIADGVLSNRDLLMKLSRLSATGKGTVGLGLRTIDYVFSPQLHGPDGPSLIVPVKINGSWSNPSVVPDLEEAVKRSFDKDIKAVEDEAKQKLEKELGLEKKEGQSTEDAIKDKLEKEALRGLQNLLGGN